MPSQLLEYMRGAHIVFIGKVNMARWPYPVLRRVISVFLIILAGFPAHGLEATSNAVSTAGRRTNAEKSPVSDLAIIASWQQDDGSWSEAPSSMGTPDGDGHQGLCTGLAVQAYLGGGYDAVIPSKYRHVIRNGLDWILAHQRPDGSFSGALIDNAIQSEALSTEFFLTNDGSIRDAARRGILSLLARRVTCPGTQRVRAWPDPDGRISTRANVFCIYAVSAALSAQLIQDGPVRDDSAAWLMETWKAANSQSRSETFLSKACAAYTDFGTSPAMTTGTELYGSLATAIQLPSRMVKPLIDSLRPQILAEHASVTGIINTSDRLLRTAVMIQYADDKTFNSRRLECQQILDGQRLTSGPRKGGWEAKGPAISPALGVVSNTMLTILMLEIFVRSD